MNTTTLTTRLTLYEKLMRLDKPVGILLLLWPALWALWIAGKGRPDMVIVWIFVIGAVLMRSAGCIVNDIADRDFDRHVARTRERPITAGLVSVQEAILLALVLTLLAFVLVLHTNLLTVILSAVALLFAVTYPYTKRFLALPQVYFGITFGFGVPMAFAAQTGTVPPIAWVLMLANLFWAFAYDTAYAMVDRDDDLKIGIRTSAITLGRHDVTGFTVCQGLFLLTMIGAGWWLASGWLYYFGLIAAAALVRYQVELVATRERDRCFRAFMNNIAVGGVVFLGILGDSYFRVPL
jgi:4-hydroxybenzoate polyprenyltransferase